MSASFSSSKWMGKLLTTPLLLAMVATAELTLVPAAVAAPSDAPEWMTPPGSLPRASLMELPAVSKLPATAEELPEVVPVSLVSLLGAATA
jgi:hypothetical protein